MGNTTNLQMEHLQKKWLDQYFVANICDNRKVSTLITLMGANAYAALRDVRYPDLPFKKTYAELSTKLQLHFTKKIPVNRKRIHFVAMRQTANEFITVKLPIINSEEF